MEWVRYVIAVTALSVPVILAVQTYRGRAKVRCCGAPADPRLDLRMRDALKE